MPSIVAAVAEHDDNIFDLVGYQKISGHLIFDVKLGKNFQRKVRFVAYSHKTDTPSYVTYSTVISRDLGITCLTIAALNDLDVLAAYIENAYLTASFR